MATLDSINKKIEGVKRKMDELQTTLIKLERQKSQLLEAQLLLKIRKGDFNMEEALALLDSGSNQQDQPNHDPESEDLT